MSRVLIHPLAGVLSAYGMGLADRTVMRERSIEAELCETLVTELQRILDEIETLACAELGDQQVSEECIEVLRRVHLRYAGTDTALSVVFGSLAQMVEQFEAAYRRQYSFLMPGRALIVEAVV